MQVCCCIIIWDVTVAPGSQKGSTLENTPANGGAQRRILKGDAETERQESATQFSRKLLICSVGNSQTLSCKGDWSYFAKSVLPKHTVSNSRCTYVIFLVYLRTCKGKVIQSNGRNWLAKGFVLTWTTSQTPAAGRCSKKELKLLTVIAKTTSQLMRAPTVWNAYGLLYIIYIYICIYTNIYIYIHMYIYIYNDDPQNIYI